MMNYSALPRKGTDAYNEIINNTALLATGIDSLDTILEGGLLTGKIYEICGLSGSGKTQLCLTISNNVAHNFKQQLYYIDSKGDFSGKRIQEMLEAKNCEDEVVGAVMERIKVTRINNIYEALSFLHHLKNNLQHEQDGQHSLRIVILDSISVLFFPFIGENFNEGLSLMQQLANIIKYIVTEYHLAFLIVNLATRIDDDAAAATGEGYCQLSNRGTTVIEGMRPAIGKSWLDVPCTRLMIHKINSGEMRQITVVKSTYLPTEKQCKMEIKARGIVAI
ncbi:hypothetical protein L9F63_013114 [Diploptera punctata]|uniref:RecA family profile 1 domain-containing protein n=1 Tax=Diploptera punctata TaxID=6984 RepID=A0AAD8AAU5_DIPPU|nr:hypothetical protein L9F63_013114 [Diploptera punctata]